MLAYYCITPNSWFSVDGAQNRHFSVAFNNKSARLLTLYFEITIEGVQVHQSMPYLNYACKSYKGLKLVDVPKSTRGFDVTVAHIFQKSICTYTILG